MRLEDQRVMELKNIGGFNAYNMQLAFKKWSKWKFPNIFMTWLYLVSED